MSTSDSQSIGSGDVASAGAVAGTPEPVPVSSVGTTGTTVDVTHPETNEVSQITLPADHDGSRVKVEFPDGATTYTEGFDPAERALSGARPTVPCANCGAPQVLTQEAFTCSACGAQNRIELRASADTAEAAATEG